VKITAPIAASAGILLAALVLTGCSAGALPGTPSSPAAGSSSNSSGSGSGSAAGSSNTGGSGGNSGPTHDYTADDLVAILKKAEATRNLSGTIKDDAQIKADLASNPGESLTQTFAASGGQFEPAACGTIMDSLLDEANKSLADSGYEGASLTATSDILNVASASGGSATAGLLASSKSTMSKLTSQCSTMSVVDGSTTIGFTISNASATSNANQTFAYEEDITIPGQAAVKTLTIEAQYGNLYIGDVSVSDPDASRMEANINAVVAAAKG